MSCVDGDRVLMAIAGGSVDNGIWIVRSSAWERAPDFDGTRDVVTGTAILVISSEDQIRWWAVTTSGTIRPGVTSIEIEPKDSWFPSEVNVKTYGAIGDGSADDSDAFEEAMSVAGADLLNIRKVRIPSGIYKITRTIYIPVGVVVEGEGISETLNRAVTQILKVGDFDAFRFVPQVSGGKNYWFGAIRRLAIFGTATDASGWGISFRDSSNATVSMQDQSCLEDIIIRRCKSGGIEVPNSGLPITFNRMKLQWNGGPGIKITSTTSNQHQSIHLADISGDGNYGGLISLNNLDDHGSVLITNLKSEAKINTDLGGVSTDQANAIVITSCDQTPIAIHGATHICSTPDGGNYEKPGSLVKITDTDYPSITWSAVAVRVRAGDTGSDPGIVETAGGTVLVPYTTPAGYFGNVDTVHRGTTNTVRHTLGIVDGYKAASVEGPAMQIAGVTPGLSLYESDQGANEKAWLIAASGGELSIRSVTDAGVDDIAGSMNRTAGVVSRLDWKKGLKLSGINSYADQTAAAAAGLVTGDVYRTLGGEVRITGSNFVTGTDITSALQAAIDAIDTGAGGTITLPRGTFTISSTITVASGYITIRGQGRNATILTATHTTGAVIWFKFRNCGIEDLQITSSGSRSSTTNTSGFGVRFEAVDIVEDTTTRMQQCFIERCDIQNQPSHGVAAMGPAMDGSRFSVCRFNSNRGHGFVVDRGLSTGRTNLPTVGIPGVLTIENCRIDGNGGHGVAAGHPSDSTTTRSLRVVVDNCEITGNATDAAVRHYAYNVYMDGTNHEIRASVMNGDGARGAVYALGRNHRYTNNRYINCTASFEIGNNSSLPTEQIHINGMTVLTLAQNPAIIMNSGASNVIVENATPSNITSMFAAGYPGTYDNRPIRIAYKTADTTINNTATLADDTGLRIWLGASEQLIFECCVEHSHGSATPDLKLTFTVPASAAIRWGPVNGIRVDAADAIVQTDEVIASGTTLDFGGATTRRAVVLTGVVHNNTTEGYLQLQWAQNTATATNTIVYSVGSYLKCWNKKFV